MLNLTRLGFIGLAIAVTLSASAYDEADYATEIERSLEPAAQLALFALAYANKPEYEPVHYRSYRQKRNRRSYRRHSSRHYGYGHAYRKRGYYKRGRYYPDHNRGYYSRRY